MDTTYDDIIDFHGHSCPGLAIGYRMTVAGLKFLLQSKTKDEELVAIIENDSCGVDALQCLSGCTFGKGNLIFKNFGKQAYTFYQRKSKKGVRVVFNSENVPEYLRQDKKSYIDWLLNTPEEQIIFLEEIQMDAPEYAKIMESVECDFCKERVMKIRTETIKGKTACIPCAMNHRAQQPFSLSGISQVPPA